jgi:hypothetical protein
MAKNKQQYEEHLNESFKSVQPFMDYLYKDKKGRINSTILRKLEAGNYGTVLKNLDFKKFDSDYKVWRDQN